MCRRLLFLAEGREKKGEREREREKGKERSLLLLKGDRNENCADPTSASVHLLARKECNGR